jgi:hypothetical protein
LGDRAAKSRTEDVFQRHFDHNLATLLERWRSWVLGRGIGSHGTPPPDIRDALMERVIPIVQDEGANAMERIQAVREMGRTGYVLGADALIEVLSNDDQIPAKEVVWSLESISGVAMGDNVATWENWFNQLPSDATRATDMPPPS